jgi:Zn-dependent membrane protease YugP
MIDRLREAGAAPARLTEVRDMGLFYAIDPLYWMLLGPAIVLAMLAQAKVKLAFSKYSKVGLSTGYSGAQAAAHILRQADLGDVAIEQSQGWLSDHYDPRSRTLRLSPAVYAGRSVSAVGVAAHEAGHALQHARGYAPMALRKAFVPMAGIGSYLAWPMIFFGFILQSMHLVQIGVILFAGLVAFQLITLPVEFNASSRAKRVLAETGIVVTEEEAKGVRSVLSAAAMTYVAATAVAVLQLLYFLLRSGLLGGGDD